MLEVGLDIIIICYHFEIEFFFLSQVAAIAASTLLSDSFDDTRNQQMMQIDAN